VRGKGYRMSEEARSGSVSSTRRLVACPDAYHSSAQRMLWNCAMGRLQLRRCSVRDAWEYLEGLGGRRGAKCDEDEQRAAGTI
jgi:hypothetical protein